MTPMQRLAAHVATAPRRAGEPLRQRAAAAFVDTLGCMVAGADTAPTRHALAAALLLEPGAVRIPGRIETASAGGAALVGGTAAHALDFDDVFEPGLTHASAVLVPALLAAVQGLAGGAPGADPDPETDADVGAALVDAFAIGLDVQAYLAEAVHPEHYAQGWHSTSTLGAPSAAAAVARLLRLGPEAAAAAIGLGISLAAGSKRQFGSDAKPLHAGLAARAGVLAAVLARSGAGTAPELLDGPWGFADLYAGPGARGFAAARDPAGLPPALEAIGLWAKPYPCCASTHRAIDAVLDLTAEAAPDWAAVEAIAAEVSPVAAANLMYDRPETPAQARFSMQHCVAAAALRGRVDAAAFAPGAVADPALRALAARVTMRADPGMAPGPDRPEATRFVVRLAGGRVLERHVAHPRGHPQRPMTAAETSAKFRACAAPRLGAEAAEAALAALWALGAPGAAPLAFLGPLVPAAPAP